MKLKNVICSNAVSYPIMVNDPKQMTVIASFTSRGTNDQKVATFRYRDDNYALILGVVNSQGYVETFDEHGTRTHSVSGNLYDLNLYVVRVLDNSAEVYFNGKLIHTGRVSLRRIRKLTLCAINQYNDLKLDGMIYMFEILPYAVDVGDIVHLNYKFCGLRCVGNVVAQVFGLECFNCVYLYTPLQPLDDEYITFAPSPYVPRGYYVVKLRHPYGFDFYIYSKYRNNFSVEQIGNLVIYRTKDREVAHSHALRFS